MDMGFSDSRLIVADESGPELRPLGWGELCARLTAAQDLRRHQSGPANHAMSAALASAGSFHALAAHMLDHHAGSQPFVNRTSSANGKGHAGTTLISRETPLIECTTHQANETCDD